MMPVFEKVYCAFCKLERGVCRKKHITWTNVLLAAICSLLIMFVVWNAIEPKAIIVFAIALIFAEVFVHLRWRLTMPCPHCHFDPLLYKRDREKAVQNVKARLDTLKTSGGHLLKTNNPFQHISRIARSETPSPQSKPNHILSRHI